MKRGWIAVICMTAVPQLLTAETTVVAELQRIRSDIEESIQHKIVDAVLGRGRAHVFVEGRESKINRRPSKSPPLS